MLEFVINLSFFQIFILSLFGFFVAFSLWVFAFQSLRNPYFSRQNLMSAAELRFFKALEQLFTDRLHICPKVRLADIVTCSDYHWARGFGGKIAQKHMDFVLIDRQSGQILCCLELDDSSHNKPERKKRDQFVNKTLDCASIPLLRFPVQSSYDLQALKMQLKQFIPS
jgi:hypothetical protein